jgi:hypothetical protein
MEPPSSTSSRTKAGSPAGVAVSRLNPEVVYPDTATIAPDDVGYKTSVYELELPEWGIADPLAVVLGKPNYTRAHRQIIYFPLYAVRKAKVRAQIGVFEVPTAQLLHIFHDGQLDVDQLEEPPVLYSFVTPAYLAKLDASPRLWSAADGSPVHGSASNPASSSPSSSPSIEPMLDDVMEDDHLHLRVRADRVSATKQATAAVAAEPVWTDVPGFQPKDPLPEETPADAERIRGEFRESVRSSWLEKFMKNSHYRLRDDPAAERNGDSFFAVVRDAFKDIGKEASVAALRALVANEMTEDVFHRYRQVFLGYADALASLQNERDQLEATMQEYKRRIRNDPTHSMADTQLLVQQYQRMDAERKLLQQKIEQTERSRDDTVGNLQHVDTLEKMRQHIQTSAFAADDWAQATLERLLNVKVIVLSEAAFAANDLTGVLLCHDVANSGTEWVQRQSFVPDYYILATVSAASVYRLVSYKHRTLLKFGELPHDMKIQVLNKCLSGTSGIYHAISDFRNFKTKFGLDPDEGVPTDYRDHPAAGDLFDPSTKFVFYVRSDKSAKPGHGDGETVHPADVVRYAPLGGKSFVDWRKKLDDEWTGNAIAIDGHRWASVEHYMQAVKFKKTHPDVYLMFSLDTDPHSELATQVKAAKAFKGLVQPVVAPSTEPASAATKKPPSSGAPQRVRVLAPDMDFNAARAEEERTKALRAKFTGNPELRNILQMTQSALLLHKGRVGEPLQPDLLLMQIRKELQPQ